MESPIPILPLSTPDVETEKLIKMKDEEVWNISPTADKIIWRELVSWPSPCLISMFHQEKYVCLVFNDEMIKIFLSSIVFVLKEDIKLPVWQLMHSEA